MTSGGICAEMTLKNVKKTNEERYEKNHNKQKNYVIELF